MYLFQPGFDFLQRGGAERIWVTRQQAVKKSKQIQFSFDSFLRAHLKLYSHHVEGGRAGQDGGVGLKKARQCCPTVPEEQRVPGQEAGAEVRLTNQD